MSRQNVFAGRVENQQVYRQTYMSVKQTLGATLTLTAAFPMLLFLDAGGAARSVLLPVAADGLAFTIVNISDGQEVLNVKNSLNTVTYAVLSPGESVDFVSDGTDWRASGANKTSTAVTATADGLTTGTLAIGGDRWIEVTSSNANNIVIFPVGYPGLRIRGWVGANGCEFRTPATSNIFINGVDADNAEAAIPATSMFEMQYVNDTVGWILLAWTELGAVITAIVPD